MIFQDHDNQNPKNPPDNNDAKETRKQRRTYALT